MSVCHDIHGLRAAGATIREIAKLTGHTPSAVHKTLGPSKKQCTERACMCCGKTFLSEGAHNRLCGGCRNRSASPYDTPAIVRYR